MSIEVRRFNKSILFSHNCVNIQYVHVYNKRFFSGWHAQTRLYSIIDYNWLLKCLLNITECTVYTSLQLLNCCNWWTKYIMTCIVIIQSDINVLYILTIIDLNVFQSFSSFLPAFIFTRQWFTLRSKNYHYLNSVNFKLFI